MNPSDKLMSNLIDYVERRLVECGIARADDTDVIGYESELITTPLYTDVPTHDLLTIDCRENLFVRPLVQKAKEIQSLVGFSEVCNTRYPYIKCAAVTVRFWIDTAGVAKKSDTRRELTHHKVNGLNDQLKIEVLDLPGAGNACHDYRISFDHEDRADTETYIRFQNGPIKESGVNGISNEALLAILIDRMEGFQSGPFACHDNQMALDALQTARLWLHKRTLDRVARGVEGTHTK